MPLAVVKAGGFVEIFNFVPPENLTLWAPGKTVVWGWILAVLPGQMVLQLYHQRIYAAKSVQVAKRGLYNVAVSGILAALWASLLGMAIFKLNPGLPDKELAMTWSIMNLLPPWLGVFILGAIIAAIVSTADSALHSTSASITRDIYQCIYKPEATDNDILRFSKRCILVLGVLGIVLAIWLPFVIKVLVLGYSLTTAGLLCPLYLGRFMKSINRYGAFSGMVGGVFTVLIVEFAPGIKSSLAPFPSVAVGLIISFIATIGVSLMFAKRVTEVIQPETVTVTTSTVEPQ